MEKIVNLCWEGLTLKHVSNKKIAVPYLLFMIQALVFELFLSVLFIAACFWSVEYGFMPSLRFYVSGFILFLLLIITVSILITFNRRK